MLNQFHDWESTISFSRYDKIKLFPILGMTFSRQSFRISTSTNFPLFKKPFLVDSFFDLTSGQKT